MHVPAVLDDPIVMAKVHGWFTIGWFATAPAALVLGWLNIVAFVSIISITAMAASHWAAREAATAQRDLDVTLLRIEQKIDSMLDSRHEDDS